MFITVPRDGQLSAGTETDLHQDRLLPDPERRPAERVHHHPADHHVCRIDQPGLRQGVDDTSWNYIVKSCFHFCSQLSQLGRKVNVK